MVEAVPSQQAGCWKSGSELPHSSFAPYAKGEVPTRGLCRFVAWSLLEPATRNIVTPISAGQRHSLWLMPGGNVRDHMSGVLHRLSVRFDAPEFAPHVTLLGSFMGERREVIQRSARVAAALRPFTIRLGELDFRDEYFRCLFVHAALTAPLRKAYQAACQEFGCGHESAFMPHLSLLYGSYTRCIKETLIAEMGTRLEVQFKVRSLYLYRTHGEPHLWRQVARFGLK